MIINLEDLSDYELVDELKENPLLIKFIKNRNSKHLATAFIYSDNKNIANFFNRLYDYEINIDFLNHLNGIGLTDMHILFLYKAIKNRPSLLPVWFNIALNMRTFSHKDIMFNFLLNKETTLKNDILKCIDNVQYHTSEFLSFLVNVMQKEDLLKILIKEKEILKSFLLIEDGHKLFSSKKIKSYIDILFKYNGDITSNIISNNKRLFMERILEGNTCLFPYIYKYIPSIFNVEEIEQINNFYDFHFYELFDNENASIHNKLIYDLIIRNNIENKNCLIGLIDIAVKKNIINDSNKGHEALKIACNHISTYFSQYTLNVIENIIKKAPLDKGALKVLFNNKHEKTMLYMQKIMSLIPLLKVKIPELNNAISIIEILNETVTYSSICKIINNIDINNQLTFKMDQI